MIMYLSWTAPKKLEVIINKKGANVFELLSTLFWTTCENESLDDTQFLGVGKPQSLCLQQANSLCSHLPR